MMSNSATRKRPRSLFLYCLSSQNTSCAKPVAPSSSTGRVLCRKPECRCSLPYSRELDVSRFQRPNMLLRSCRFRSPRLKKSRIQAHRVDWWILSQKAWYSPILAHVTCFLIKIGHLQKRNPWFRMTLKTPKVWASLIYRLMETQGSSPSPPTHSSTSARWSKTMAPIACDKSYAAFYARASTRRRQLICVITYAPTWVWSLLSVRFVVEASIGRVTKSDTRSWGFASRVSI